jgi:hypothetical protein
MRRIASWVLTGIFILPLWALPCEAAQATTTNSSSVQAGDGADIQLVAKRDKEKRDKKGHRNGKKGAKKLGNKKGNKANVAV